MNKKLRKMFKDEKDFTLNAVIPWLKTRREHGSVEYTGGSDEFGRDVVFSKDEIGNRKIWWAVQVKDDDIKGKHKGDSSIREIINQIKSAISMPYTKRGETSKIMIQGMMVVTLGKVTRNAAKLIQESDDLKGRPVIFYEYDDLLNDIKKSPLNVSSLKFLIRLKDSNENASLEDLERNLNKIKPDFLYKIYNHKPIEDMFESYSDNYVDMSFDLSFEGIFDKQLWKKITKIIKDSNFYVSLVNLRLYYPRVFKKEDLKDLKDRLFSDMPIVAYEDQLGPCFVYNGTTLNFSKEVWIKNVNNLQILQKN